MQHSDCYLNVKNIDHSITSLIIPFIFILSKFQPPVPCLFFPPSPAYFILPNVPTEPPPLPRLFGTQE